MRFIGILIVTICLMAISFSTAYGACQVGCTCGDPNCNCGETGQCGEGSSQGWDGSGTQTTFTTSGGTSTYSGESGWTSYGGAIGSPSKGVLVIGTTLSSPLAGDTRDNPTLPSADSLALAQQMINDARLLQQEVIEKEGAYQNGQISYEEYSNYLITARKRADAILLAVNNLDNAIKNAMTEAGSLNLNIPEYVGSKEPIPIIGGEG